MMRILIVNPNTTVAMTDAIRRAAQRYASPGTEIVATEARVGPESIEGFFEGYLSVIGVFDRLQSIDFDFDALVMAGFGEPGREGAQELLDVPVFDITECAAHVACLLGRTYSVVTPLDRSVPGIEDRLQLAGLSDRCASVRATGLGVLEVDQDEGLTIARITDVARLAIDNDRAEVICLGCGGMAGLDEKVAAALGVPVVDGVAAAVKLAEAVVGLGLKTSKIRSYAPPRPKRFTSWPLSRPGSNPRAEGGTATNPT
jgi:allantoin racemase